MASFRSFMDGVALFMAGIGSNVPPIADFDSKAAHFTPVRTAVERGTLSRNRRIGASMRHIGAEV